MKIQWLGHSAVKISTETHCLLVDPFLTHNPKAPLTWREAAEGLTHVLLTHGHSDHVGDTVPMVALTGATVVAMPELCRWLRSVHGVRSCEPLHYGGTVDLDQGHSVTFVPAWHSSVAEDGTPLGAAAGLIIRTPSHTLYHAGDTCIFSDMALIAELYRPSIGFIPVGGRYTMDGPTAALACRRFFQFDTIVPIHFGTFDQIAPNADAFLEHGIDLPIQPLHPGQVITL